MVRRVWYRKEYARPSYLRHMFVIRTVDLCAWLFLGAAFFLMLNTGHVMRTLVVTTMLLGYDVFLNRFFLNFEARRICAKTPGLTLDSAKRRLLERIKHETAG